jgi:hypothetical protein
MEPKPKIEKHIPEPLTWEDVLSSAELLEFFPVAQDGSIGDSLGVQASRKIQHAAHSVM